MSITERDQYLYLREKGGRSEKNRQIGISVKSTGKPGEILPEDLSAPNFLMDRYGRMNFIYKYPKFESAQVDTLTVTCDLCKPIDIEIKVAPVMVGLFNGVWNTEPDAQKSVERSREATEALNLEMPIIYDHFYNQSGCGQPGTTCLQDLAETFIQRQGELDGVLVNRVEHFWEILSGRYADEESLTGKILGYLGKSGSGLAALLDSIFNSMIGQMAGGWSRMVSDPPTGADLAAQLAKLQKHSEAGSPLVLVGHSQGNLFLNAAFDEIGASDSAPPVKAIHIGPASPTLKGAYVLADIDWVINFLRFQGVNSVPSPNLELPFSRVDASGHMLMGTYLDPKRVGLSRIQELLQKSLAY